MKVADFPRQIRIENTTSCNARCTMCPREKLSRDQGTMDIGFFKDLARQAVEGGTEQMHLQGYGEPFLDKSIFEKISFAKSAGIPYTFMVTNASLLSEGRIRDLLDSGLDKLKISFYGVDAEEYEKVHINLNYEEVRDNVDRLLRMKKASGKDKPIISLKYIGPLRRFPKFILQWWPRTVVSYSRLHNYVDGRQFKQPHLDKSDRKCAFIAKPFMMVLWDGRVVPCCYDFNGKIILGDLRKESIRDVWHGEKYEALRAIHREKRFKDAPFCNVCDKLR